jgi:hypothetical protein
VTGAFHLQNLVHTPTAALSLLSSTSHALKETVARITVPESRSRSPRRSGRWTGCRRRSWTRTAAGRRRSGTRTHHLHEKPTYTYPGPGKGRHLLEFPFVCEQVE